MNAALLVAREEGRWLRRGRVAPLALALWLLLAAVAAFTAWEQRSRAAAQRERHQHQMDEAFEAQPDRHPHRMVHYGHFAFRPLGALAAFDPGTDAYTGHTLFLEGHRQNSANFGEVRQSSLLLRFGQLTPAFVLQVLAPLLLVFIGHAAVAREREAGTLRSLLAQGLSARTLVAGKALALGGVAALMLLPAALALAATVAFGQAPVLPALGLALGYAVALALWVLVVVAVSALCRRGRDALLVLLALWVAAVVVLPRAASELASTQAPLPTRVETDITIRRELAALADAHNAGDVRHAAFRQRMLAQYGVSRIEDLPLNYKGLVAMESERQTSELFVRHANESFARQEAQQAWVDRFAVLSPVLALRRLSMVLAGTDLQAYRRFMEGAEAHRYQMVQALNRLQAEQMTLQTDRSSRDDRISRVHWQGVADFEHRPEASSSTLQRALPAAAVLLAWLIGLGGLLFWAARRLGRGQP
ncbi:ABC transporter permease [beta proteobacterium AAP121]|nr:ABC transporter permease [beta proteobacterium AAP65]KPF94344.1 ABC transporter permease [beta proteobacterium AAP121]